MTKRKTTLSETVVDVDGYEPGEAVLDDADTQAGLDTPVQAEIEDTHHSIQTDDNTEPEPIKAVEVHNRPAATAGIEGRIRPKRIRDRRKATKKLSAAILCANPGLKRFS